MSPDGGNIAIEAAEPLGETIERVSRASAWRRLMRVFARFGIYYNFNSITGRIVALNILSLLVLIIGMLYLSDYRDRLIAARGKSLQIEAEIIARALMLEEPARLADGADDAIFGQPVDNAYTISMEKSAELLRGLIGPTNTHGSIYLADGTWLIDTDRIYKGGQITQYLNPTKRIDEVSTFYRLWLQVESALRWESFPKLTPAGMQNGKNIIEVKTALEQGVSVPLVRENELGESILSNAVPLQKGGKVLGALLLTTADGDIDNLLADERISVMRLWALVLAVTVCGSFILAGTIAKPMRRLASAAGRVRMNIKAREDIPEFAHRSDEIGNLARALREMTAALYARLDAIESFAADVSHEIKNPLTSLQSAVDTFSLVKKEEDREHLVQIIKHDIQRLNRLISDISDASRLDAEMARESRRPVNIAALLMTLYEQQNDIHHEHGESKVKVEVEIKGVARAIAMGGRSPFTIDGHERRLSQVIYNLLDNAISFSPKDGKVRIICNLLRPSKEIEIAIEDDGPGIRVENLERIFERFYTDRPDQADFGNNSGLGLNISRQIVQAHKGSIWAENRMAPVRATKAGEETPLRRVLGARFVIRLPAA